MPIRVRGKGRTLRAESRVSQSDVREHVFEQMKDRYRKAMVNSFVNKMLWLNALRKDAVYNTIKQTVTDLKVKDEFDDEEAWKFATSKRKYLFDRLLKCYEAPELSSEEEDEHTDIHVEGSQGGEGGG